MDPKKFLAIMFHHEWRIWDWWCKKGNNPETPRKKPTRDTEWLRANAGQPYCYPDTGEIDINIDYPKLSKDWQEDNYEAAGFALETALLAESQGWLASDDYLDRAGAAIHLAWLKRRREIEGDKEEFQKLDIPFNTLEEWRQDQDRRHADLARRYLLAQPKANS